MSKAVKYMDAALTILSLKTRMLRHYRRKPVFGIKEAGLEEYNCLRVGREGFAYRRLRDAEPEPAYERLPRAARRAD